MSKVLFISPVLSHPENLGNRVHIAGMLKTFRQSGKIVHYLHVGYERGPREEQEATAKHCDKFFFVKNTPPPLMLRVEKYVSQQKGEACAPWGIDDWCDPGVELFVNELQQREEYDIVVVQYVFLSRVFSCFDESVLKVLNTLNVFTDRQKIFIEHGERTVNFFTSIDQEKIGVNRADLICAIQEGESGFFRKLTDKQVITIGNPVKIERSEPHSWPTAKTLLFVGSRHTPNLRSITHFLEHIFPEIRKLEPSVLLEIAGSVFAGSGLSVFPEGCYYRGVVEDLSELYKRAAVVINPMLFGTGLNIKMIEALGHGKPTVTTTVGARGLAAGQNKAFIVADSDQDFAQAVVRLLNDRIYSNKLANEARRFAISYNRACRAPLLKFVKQYESYQKKAVSKNQSTSNL